MRLWQIAPAALLLAASQAFGAGFIGPGSPAPVTKATAALKAADDAPCTLVGHILSRVVGRKNRYIFRDDSGQIVVEIKKKVFGESSVTPKNLVRLDGEVEVDDKYPNEVEVDTLTVLE